MTLFLAPMKRKAAEPQRRSGRQRKASARVQSPPSQSQPRPKKAKMVSSSTHRTFSPAALCSAAAEVEEEGGKEEKEKDEEEEPKPEQAAPPKPLQTLGSASKTKFALPSLAPLESEEREGWRRSCLANIGGAASLANAPMLSSSSARVVSAVELESLKLSLDAAVRTLGDMSVQSTRRLNVLTLSELNLNTFYHHLLGVHARLAAGRSADGHTT